MSAELTLALMKSPDQAASAIVPVTAIDKRDQDGRVQVWVYQTQSGEVKPAAVTLGRVTSEGVEVLGGINNGDLIVSAGVSQLSDGMKVKPLRWQRGV